ncbi:hypothetical protein OAG66_00230, partial [bacterium]|nr:hypothetical protein [bacterium]
MADKKPLNKSSIYLGTWCFSKACAGIGAAHDVFPFVWNDRSKYNLHGKIVTERRIKLFNYFIDTLNYIHNMNQSKRYWAIISQKWFDDYLQIFYDRFYTIKQFINHNSLFEYRCLKPINFITPISMWKHYTNLSSSDFENEQLYSQILNPNYLKYIKFDRIKYNNNFTTPNAKNSIKLYSMYQAHPEDINAIKNKIGGLAEIVSFENEIERIYKCNILSYQRLSFENYLNTQNDEFEKLFIRSLVVNTPKVLIEGFNGFRRHIIENFEIPRISVTTNDHICSFISKLVMAESVNAGGKLIWGQHGGNYKAFGLDLEHQHEYENCDKYFSWGWASENQKKYVNMPSLNASGIIHRCGNEKIKLPLLYISSTGSKYSPGFRSHVISSEFIKYSKMQVEFINKLSKDIRNKIVYRPHLNDGDMGIVDNVIRQNPNINILKDGDISTAINQFKFIILDRPDCSNFSNLLAINKPFIVFFDKKNYIFS